MQRMHPVRRTRQERINVAARSGLRVGFRGCRQRERLRALRWNHLAVILLTSLLEDGMLPVPPKRKVSEPKLGTPFLISVEVQSVPG